MSVVGAFAVPHPPILLPEVGHGEEAKLKKTEESYRLAMERAAALGPDTVVILSPHSVMYADYFHISPGSFASGDMSRFGAGNVKFRADYDTKFVLKLSELAEMASLPAGTLGEKDKALDHGTMIPLYFLNRYLSDYKLVRIGLSGLPPLTHYRFGQAIAQAARDLGRRTVIIASGDLSHKLLADGPYGYAPEGPAFDRQVTEALGRGDFPALLDFEAGFAEAAAECGLRSFQVMAGAFDRIKVDSALLSYEGPFGVGYAVASFEPLGPDDSRDFGAQYDRRRQKDLESRKAGEDAYVRLARLSLETHIKAGVPADMPENLPPELLNTKAGTFVSLKKNGQLRGCIGTISPTCETVAEEIMQNAVSAALRDPRFDPVTESELDELVYSVDVLGPAEVIGSPEALDVKRYGVIVEKGGRRGLLLPNLEGVDTVDRQILIAKQKAGIGAKEKVVLRRFEVVRHK